MNRLGEFNKDQFFIALQGRQLFGACSGEDNLNIATTWRYSNSFNIAVRYSCYIINTKVCWKICFRITVLLFIVRRSFPSFHRKINFLSLQKHGKADADSDFMRNIKWIMLNQLFRIKWYSCRIDWIQSVQAEGFLFLKIYRSFKDHVTWQDYKERLKKEAWWCFF